MTDIESMGYNKNDQRLYIKFKSFKCHVCGQEHEPGTFSYAMSQDVFKELLGEL